MDVGNPYQGAHSLTMIKNEPAYTPPPSFKRLNEIELKSLDSVLTPLIRNGKSVIGAQQVWLERRKVVSISGEPNEQGYWPWSCVKVITTEHAGYDYFQCMDEWAQWHDWARRSRFDDLVRARFPKPIKLSNHDDQGTDPVSVQPAPAAGQPLAF